MSDNFGHVNHEKIDIPSRGGTYLLFFNFLKTSSIKIGSLGTNPFKKGFYLYIGSALGPGGLQKRLARHLRVEKKLYWHIDYLLNDHNSRMNTIAYQISILKNECLIANLLIDNFSDYLQPIKYFGSSDCNCISHLFFSETKNYNIFITKFKQFSYDIDLHFIFNELPLQENL